MVPVSLGLCCCATNPVPRTAVAVLRYGSGTLRCKRRDGVLLPRTPTGVCQASEPDTPVVVYTLLRSVVRLRSLTEAELRSVAEKRSATLTRSVNTLRSPRRSRSAADGTAAYRGCCVQRYIHSRTSGCATAASVTEAGQESIDGYCNQ